MTEKTSSDGVPVSHKDVQPNTSSDSHTDGQQQRGPGPALGEPLTGSNPASQSFWANVGKFATLVGLIVGIFTVFRFIWPSGPNILADCQVVDNAVPPPSLMLGYLSKDIEEQFSPKNIENALSAVDETSRWTPAEKSKAIQSIGNFLHAPSFVEMDRFQMASDLLQCRIINDSSQPAHQVVFDLPIAPSIVLVNRTTFPLSKDQTSIMLGDIRPGTDLNLRAWFMLAPPWFQDTLHLSHQDGTGKVSLFDATRNYPGRIARFVISYGNHPWLAAALALIILLGAVNLGLSSRSQSKRSNSKS